jgi:hypothetical protein
MSILAQFIGLPDFGQSQSEKENSKGDVGSRISLKSAKLNTIHEDKSFLTPITQRTLKLQARAMVPCKKISLAVD